MKKVLSTVAALGLVAGIATSAAALELKVKGDYLVEGYSISKAMGVLGGNGLALAHTAQDGRTLQFGTDAYYQHKFTINADLKVNDSITMKTRIRLVDYASIWGKQDDTQVGNGNNFAVKRLWMVYKSPIGQWEIGRRPAGSWESTFVNNGTRADRIMWKSGKVLGDDFNMYAFLQKTEEVDGYVASSNLDNDYYEVYGAYTGYGKTSIGIGYKQDNTDDFDGGFTVETARVKGYGKYPFADAFSLEVEFDYIFGDKDFNNALNTSMDIEGFAFMTAFDANFGAASANLMYFYISGDDNGSTDGESSAYSTSNGTGNDFEPLYILTGTQTSILNNDIGSDNEFGVAARTAGAHAVVASGDYQASEKLAFHGAIGWAQAADEKAGWENDYGYEFDAGASYKLLDNLTYNLHFGYLATGDFFKGANEARETNSVTLWYNNLSMTF
jgi:hypothetical protein